MSLLTNSGGTIFNPGDNKLRVRISGDVQNIPGLPDNYNVLNAYGFSTDVASSVEVDVLTYMVPVSQTLYVDRIQFSGDNVSKYQVEIDSTVQAVYRTYWSNFNGVLEFGGMSLSAGQVIKLTAIHERPMLGDYDARLLGILGPG